MGVLVQRRVDRGGSVGWSPWRPVRLGFWRGGGWVAASPGWAGEGIGGARGGMDPSHVCALVLE